jgi:hypothetical protein
VHGRWTLNRVIHEAVRARLDETPLGALEPSGRTVPFEAEPGEIVTILLR